MNVITKFAAALLVTLSLAACGTSGNDSAAPSVTNTLTIPVNATTDTRISGMATKGPINGTANFFALNPDGSKGGLLKSSPIVFGNYSSNIGKYNLPVVIEVTGSYTDEATGELRTITADAPMRAALPNATGKKSVAVTPLTEIAVRKAGVLTAANITAGNTLVSDIFKFNIIDTQPVAPTKEAIAKVKTTNQKEYTLALAALSQLSMTRGESFDATLKSVVGDISSSGMTSRGVTSFQQAVSEFVTNNGNNATGITDPTTTNLAKINGGTTVTFTLAIQGSIPANSINGIQFDVILPTGVIIRTDTTSGETVPLPGIVAAVESIASAKPQLYTIYQKDKGVLKLILATDPKTGIGSGDLATITCDIVPGWQKPSAAAFSVKNIKAVDSTATVITGVNVTVK
jgi:hypothetical protein